jgi:hypothetical protein
MYKATDTLETGQTAIQLGLINSRITYFNRVVTLKENKKFLPFHHYPKI